MVRNLGVVHIQAVATGAECIVLVAVASEYTGVRVEQGQAVAAFASRKDAILSRIAAIERLGSSEGRVAKNDDGGD